MAAYAAAVSLMHIIDLIKNHPSPPISFDKQQLHSLIEVVTFLQEFLEGYVSPYNYSDEADPLEMRIADVVYAAEDVIESYIVDNIHHATKTTDNDGDDDDDYDCNDDDDDEEEEEEEDYSSHDGDDNDEDYGSHDHGGEVMQSYKVDNTDLAARTTHDNNDDMMESYIVDNIQSAAAAAHDEDEQIRYINFYQGLQEVIEAMDLIKKEVMGLVKGKGGLEAELPRNVSVDAAFKSSSTESKSAMVGFEYELLQLKERLVGGDSNRQIIPIVGMGGIGKTTLAQNVFVDKLIVEYFDICLWATISQDYNIEQTLSEVLSSQGRGNSGVEGLGEDLHKYLYGRRYLVVLDDMWSIEVWDKMRFFFPDCGKRSRVIVTTRISNLAAHLSSSDNSLCMSFLNEEDSWTLFSKTVYGDKDTTFLDLEPQLREIGKKIVGKCKGLPLSIAVIGGLLARSERTQGYWKYIEENLSSIVNLENEEYCLRVLKLSYNHLPAYLKPCFLYMGMFDEDSEIKVSKIIHLWVSEGFLKPKKGKENLETVAREYLQELVDRNLVLAVDDLNLSKYLFESNCKLGSIGDNIEFCKMHDLVRDLSLREAQKQRFYYIYSKVFNHPRSHRHSHRRIVIPKQSGGTHVPKIMLESSSNPRSYISHDDYAQLFPDFRLLRTLHSHSGNYFNHHVYSQKEVFGLVNARLLSVPIEHKNYWGDTNVLDSSISRLWSLHTLILQSDNNFQGPVEFWNMHQLKHVEFIRLDLRLPLPPPPNNGNNIVIMENLHTLIGMVDFYLNEDVVRRLPNLKILDVLYWDELVSRKVHCLSYLQRLGKLESFRCSANEGSGENLESICFPQSLRQILLVDEGFMPIEKIELGGILQKIGWLPFLEEVVIQNGIFKSGEWEMVEGQFPRLKILELAECGGLRKWTMPEGSSHFPLLEKLILYQLEELEEIPLEIGEIATLKSIRVSYCSRSAMLSAKKIVEEQEELYGEEELSFRVQVLCDDEELLKSSATPNFQVKRHF